MGTPEHGALPEGAEHDLAKNPQHPAQRDDLPPFRNQSATAYPEDQSLDLLASLDEPEQLALSLEKVARLRKSRAHLNTVEPHLHRAWAII